MQGLNFLLAGVGGQGTVLASDILAEVGMGAGYDVKKSDVLGLAVRGGSVASHIRWGETVHSPVITEGQVDYLVGLEILEGLRWLKQLKPHGTVLVNHQRIPPVAVTSGEAKYPSDQEITDALSAATKHYYFIPGLALAQELGNARVMNLVLLGSLSILLEISAEIWERVINKTVPANLVDLNLKAFHTGRSAMKEIRNS